MMLKRESCWGREEWIINDNRKTEIIADQKVEIEQKDAEIAENDAEIERLKKELAAKKGD